MNEKTNEKLIETRVSSESVFDGRLLHIYRDVVRLPDGNTATREYNRHVGAVCVLPLDGDEVILERQFRYPIGQVLLEIPAGKLDAADEDPLGAAKRELEEETGYRAAKWESLGYFFPTPAYTDEKIHMYLATGLTRGHVHRDEDEFLDVIRMPLDELLSEIARGNVPDIKTQAAAMRAAQKRNQADG